MTGAPRSQRLLYFASTAAANSPIWQSPDGFVTLVKSLHVENRGAAAGEIRIIAGPAQGGEGIAMLKLPIEAASALSWAGWFACNPGDAFYVFCSVADLVVWVSGAVLAGPNQFPPATRSFPAQQPSPRPGQG